jgi:NTE family protein
VSSRSYPHLSAMLDELRQSGTRAPVEIVMLRPEGEDPEHILKWRELCKARAHYYLRPGSRSDYESLARQLSGRGIGVVLGGGGARGFAHIGLIRALRELDIPVDAAGGSSMGAFFAALTACGYTHEEMLHIARETFVQHNYLNDYLFPSVALIRGRKFSRRLHELFEERRIESLRTPYFCVSTNLTRGRAMVHDHGPLHLWVATSMCVPGVAPPVAWNGDLLADGSVINSLPTDVMQAWGRGPIVASDVSTEGGISAPGVVGPDPEALFKFKKEDERPGLFAIVFRTATLTSESGTAQRASRADAYVRMPVSGVALFDWKKLDQVVERGYQHALEKLTAVRDQLLKS